MSEHFVAEGELETHDIYFAAFLFVSGCELARKRRQGQRVYFVFTNKGGPIQDLKTAFFTNAGQVKAHQFAQQIVAVKQMCFDD